MSHERTILYYPTIDIPKGPWLNQAVLYYDSIASIKTKQYNEKERDYGYSMQFATYMVPSESQGWKRNLDRPFIQGDEFRYLNEMGIYQPIYADEFLKSISHTTINQFAEEFFSLLQHPVIHEEIVKTRGNTENTWILQEVMPDFIYDKLKRDELAGNKYLDGPSGLFHFTVNPMVGHIYGSTMAKYITEYHQDSFKPLTENQRYWDLNFRLFETDEYMYCPNVVFDRILPVPEDNIPIEEIILFKNDHRRELGTMRKAISQLEEEIAKCENGAEIKDISVSLSEDIEGNVNALEELLSENRIEYYSTQFSLIIATVGTITSEYLPITDTSGISSTLVAIGMGGISLIANYASHHGRNQQILQDNPYSYIFHGKRSGII